MEERDKLYKKAVDNLKRENTNIKEKMKLLEKRLDFTQDENAKLAIEVQAVIQGVKHIMEIGLRLAERERVNEDMGIKDEEPTPPKPDNLGIG